MCAAWAANHSRGWAPPARAQGERLLGAACAERGTQRSRADRCEAEAGPGRQSRQRRCERGQRGQLRALPSEPQGPSGQRGWCAAASANGAMSRTGASHVPVCTPPLTSQCEASPGGNPRLRDVELGSEASHAHTAWPKVSPKVMTAESQNHLLFLEGFLTGDSAQVGPFSSWVPAHMSPPQRCCCGRSSTSDANSAFRLRCSSTLARGDNATQAGPRAAHLLPLGSSLHTAQGKPRGAQASAAQTLRERKPQCGKASPTGTEASGQTLTPLAQMDSPEMCFTRHLPRPVGRSQHRP